MKGREMGWEGERLAVIQQVLAAQGTEEYRGVQQQGAQRLGISLRSLQRLMRQWKEEGGALLSRQKRSDDGQMTVREDWRKFIETTYEEGNRGSRRMSRAQVALRVQVRAEETGEKEYPSRATVYRLLQPLLDQRKLRGRKRSIGWKGSELKLTTREGLEIGIEWSNQVWQCDHTKVDVLVVGGDGKILGRPWLTLVVDTYSRCLMGLHLGFDAPSSAVVCLALRHGILPKQYSGAYELKQRWGTYGLPQYLYTDGGKDFQSRHLEQVAMELGIVLCLRRKPSDGGIVERPFGTLNQEFFSSLPGYVGSNVLERSPQAEREACLTLLQMEQLLVRYVVDRYNPGVDARTGNQSRMERWEKGRMAQLPLLGERELDRCLMKRERRMVYRGGYLQFANLTYHGEHLAAYAGESVVVRYHPSDITSLYLYQIQENREVFLTRAHAMGWETETLSYREAQENRQKKRQGVERGEKESALAEVRDRDERIRQLQRQKKLPEQTPHSLQEDSQGQVALWVAPEAESVPPPEVEKKPVPKVAVYDYEQIKRDLGLW